MTLIEAVRQIESFDEEDTIYAAEPWTENSEVLVTRELPSGRVPPKAEELGLTYFLEVSIAREFLEGWEASLGARLSIQAQCARLIQYAITDA